jgi:hypothetical protein
MGVLTKAIADRSGGGEIILVSDKANYMTQVGGDQVTVEVGVDWGNGRTLAVGSNPNGGAPVSVTFPSAVALMAVNSAELFRQRGGGAASWGLLEADEHIYQREGGMETPVGMLALRREQIERSAVTTGRGDDNRYITMGPILVDTALCLLYPLAERITARLCVGLPLKLWSEERRDHIESALTGTRKVCLDGRDVQITITSVQVNAEGHAAWLTLPPSRKEGWSFILDIGSRTSIGAILHKGVVARTAVAELGVEMILDTLNSALAARLRPLYLIERYELLEAIRDGRGYKITHRGLSEDIAPAARTLFKQAAPRILQSISPEIPLGQADYADVVGGGVYFLGEDLRRVWKDDLRMTTDLVLAAQPETLTAWGYYTWLTGNAMPVKRSGGRKPVRKG